MAFVKKIECEEGVIGVWELTDTTETLLNEFEFFKEEAHKFGQLKLEKRKKEFLAVRLLLEKLLEKKVELYYGENGNPHIKNNTINLSISHSAELAVVFLSKLQCGIDTESITRNTLSIAKRYLSEAELKNTEKNSDPALARIICWAAKEAMYKCALEKEVQFNNQILLDYFKISESGNFSGKMLFNSGGTRFFNLWYFFFQNNVIVYCVEK